MSACPLSSSPASGFPISASIGRKVRTRYAGATQGRARAVIRNAVFQVSKKRIVVNYVNRLILEKVRVNGAVVTAL